MRKKMNVDDLYMDRDSQVHEMIVPAIFQLLLSIRSLLLRKHLKMP